MNYEIQLTEKQLATVQAALLLYRDADLDQEEEVNRVATQDWLINALNRGETDELLKSIGYRPEIENNSAS
jgi:hypothetical protein